MTQVIVFPTSFGIAISSPLDCGLTIDEIAKNVVTAGAPYRIVDASIIPTDRTFRNAWEFDFSNPDGYGVSGAPVIPLNNSAEV
jgi:hypothetical protein